MRWAFWRRAGHDTTPEARAHLERLQAQQREVDRLVCQLERRGDANNFRAAFEEAMNPRKE